MTFPTRFRKTIIVAAALMLLAGALAGIGYYLTHHAYRWEWQQWQELPRDVQWQAAELEVERLFHRLWQPSPDPARMAHVTQEQLEERTRLGADWLLKMQEPSGRFRYFYEPEQDIFNHPNADNFLRQAGTAFSLMLVYEATGSPEYMAGAQKALEWQMGFLKLMEPDKAYFLFRNKAKLGGISLPMLTMLKVRQLTGSEEYDSTLIRLASMILHLQELYGTGQYKSTYVYLGDYEYEEHSGWESRIYPGEAMFALAHMYRAFGDAAYRESIDKALNFYSKKRRWRSHAFIPWTISAFTRLYQDTTDQRYANFVLQMGDHLLTQQNLDSDDEVYGSFHGVPTANTGSYLEGLGDAILLAQLVGDTKRFQRYQEHAKMGYGWLFKLQYTEANMTGIRQPDKALGGIRTSLYEARLRIDNTQHSISGFTRGLWYVFNQRPAVTPALSAPSP